MRSHFKKGMVFVMFMTVGLVFSGTAAWAGVGVACQTVEDSTASLESTNAGKVYCADHSKLNETYFSHGLCQSGLCYQYFLIVCNDGVQTEYQSMIGELDCQWHPNPDNPGGGGGGGGGGGHCVTGPGIPCPYDCAFCDWPQEY